MALHGYRYSVWVILKIMFGEPDFRTITVFVKCFETITELTGYELLIGSFFDMTLVCWYVWVLLYLWVG